MNAFNLNSRIYRRLLVGTDRLLKSAETRLASLDSNITRQFEENHDVSETPIAETDDGSHERDVDEPPQRVIS